MTSSCDFSTQRDRFKWPVAPPLVQVFRSHGAVELTPALLTPCTGPWETRTDAVRVMTSSGGVCHLPYDLRLPFARCVLF